MTRLLFKQIYSCTEPNRTQSNRLSSIGSEFELTKLVFDLVRLPNSIKFNPWFEFDFRAFD